MASALHKLELTDTLAYKLSAVATLALFTLMRVVASPLCLVSLWQSRALWGAHALLFRFNLAVTAFFVALNYLWWFKLMRRAFGGSRPAPAQGKARRGPAPASAGKRD